MTVDAAGRMFLNETEVDSAKMLGQGAAAMFEQQGKAVEDRIVVLRIDRGTQTPVFKEVLDELSTQGVKWVAVGEPEN